MLREAMHRGARARGGCCERVRATTACASKGGAPHHRPPSLPSSGSPSSSLLRGSLSGSGGHPSSSEGGPRHGGCCDGGGEGDRGEGYLEQGRGRRGALQRPTHSWLGAPAGWACEGQQGHHCARQGASVPIATHGRTHCDAGGSVPRPAGPAKGGKATTALAKEHPHSNPWPHAL